MQIALSMDWRELQTLAPEMSMLEVFILITYLVDTGKPDTESLHPDTWEFCKRQAKMCVERNTK